VSVNRKKKHRKSEELKHLQAKEVVTGGESVEPVSSKAIADSSKKTKSEMAFQKAKEERVTDHEISLLTESTTSIFVLLSDSQPLCSLFSIICLPNHTYICNSSSSSAL